MRSLEFLVGDKVFLKIRPVNGMRRFYVREKLGRRYIEPYKIIEQLNLMAYTLDL